MNESAKPHPLPKEEPVSLNSPTVAIVNTTNQPGLLSDAEYEAMMTGMQEAGDWMAAQLRSRATAQQKPEASAD